nr:MAG TPA: hypothetical protein [Caudoviricetes sp.]
MVLFHSFCFSLFFSSPVPQDSLIPSMPALMLVAVSA